MFCPKPLAISSPNVNTVIEGAINIDPIRATINQGLTNPNSLKPTPATPPTFQNVSCCPILKVIAINWLRAKNSSETEAPASINLSGLTVPNFELETTYVIKTPIPTPINENIILIV